ncbi:MAG: hypothetical protein CMO01_01250 [Thalassobius sp.]|nr:hypothetical protein [Thalassovita sp.]
MVLNFLFSILLTLNSSTVTDRVYWHEGAVTLKNNLSLTGEISFNEDHTEIKYKSALYEKTFMLNELAAFTFTDYELGIERYFITEAEEEKTALYEVIVEGRLPVYRKLREELDNPFSNSLTEEDYDFFIKKENELVKIRDFETKILPKITWEFPFEIRNFVYTYNLKIKITGHIVLIMQHYNALTSPNIDHSRVQKLLSTR